MTKRKDLKKEVKMQGMARVGVTWGLDWGGPKRRTEANRLQ